MPEYSDPSLNNLDFDDLTVYHEDGDRGTQKKFIDLNNEGWVPGGPEVRNDLQYPLDLGDVDLGHFVLFSVYEAAGFKMGEVVDVVRKFSSLTSRVAVDNTAKGIQNLGVFPVDQQTQQAQDAQDIAEQARLGSLTVEATRNALPGLKQVSSKAEVRHITRVKSPLRRSLDTVALYMPEKIQTSYGMQYEETNFGAMGIVRSLFSLFEQSTDKNAVIGELAQDVGVGLAAKLADSAASLASTDLNVGSLIEAKTQEVKNPHMEVLFKGVDNRNFEFTFNFKPRSLDEANMVHTIMKVFKKHAHPKVSDGGRFLTHPSEFEITYFTGRSENTYLNRIARCVLKNINVDYSAAGVLSTFDRPFDNFNTRDWAGAPPTNINMTLSFQEVVNMDQEFMEAGY